MVYIQLPDMNDSFSRLVLQGKEYLARFTYSDTDDSWTFGLYKGTREPIITGMKLVPCFPINRYFKSKDMPDGIFGVLTKLDRVGRNAFTSGDAKFVFIPTDEITEEASAYNG